MKNEKCLVAESHGQIQGLLCWIKGRLAEIVSLKEGYLWSIASLKKGSFHPIVSFSEGNWLIVKVKIFPVDRKTCLPCDFTALTSFISPFIFHHSLFRFLVP